MQIRSAVSTTSVLFLLIASLFESNVFLLKFPGVLRRGWGGACPLTRQTPREACNASGRCTGGWVEHEWEKRCPAPGPITGWETHAALSQISLFPVFSLFEHVQSANVNYWNIISILFFPNGSWQIKLPLLQSIRLSTSTKTQHIYLTALSHDSSLPTIGRDTTECVAPVSILACQVKGKL